MAQLDLDQNNAKYQIRGYQPGLMQINEQMLTQSLIITPNQLIENWPPQTIEELTAEHLKMITDLKPDILLIGTGSKHVLLKTDIYGELVNQGIGVEVMSTAAACRTFNALASEDRKVAAALIIK
ncbi:MAG: Mth938-like domain-containing protein [Gammaproteobacteria bacterium]